MVKKKYQNKKGGLNQAGRDYYNRTTGSHLKRPQPNGGPRKRSFCARFGGIKGPDYKNGKKTRLKLAKERWHCGRK